MMGPSRKKSVGNNKGTASGNTSQVSKGSATVTDVAGPTNSLAAEKLVRVHVTLDAPLEVRPSPLSLHASSKSAHHPPGKSKAARAKQQQRDEEMMESGVWETTLPGTVNVGRLKEKALAFFLANDDEAADKLANSYRVLSVEEGLVLKETERLNSVERGKPSDVLEIILLKNGMRPTDTGDLRDMEKGPSSIEILKATTHLKKAHVDRVADPPYSLLEMQLQMRKIFGTLLYSACKLQSKDVVIQNLLIQTRERLSKKIDEFPDLDQEKLKNLTDMGFPKRRAAQALAMTRQNVKNAMAWLLKHPRDVQPVMSGKAAEPALAPISAGKGKAESTTTVGPGASAEQSATTTETAPRTGSAPTRGKKRMIRGKPPPRITGYYSPHSPRVFAGSPLSQSPFVTSPRSTKEPKSPVSWDSLLKDVLHLMNEYHRVHFVPHMGMMRSLVEMGFPDEQVESCLRLTGNRRGAALEMLLAGKGKHAMLYEEPLDRENPVITAIVKQPVVQFAMLKQKIVAALLNLLEAPMTLQIWMTDPDVNGFLGSVIRVFHAEKHNMDKDVEEAIEKLPQDPPPKLKGSVSTGKPTTVVPPAPNPTPGPINTPPRAPSNSTQLSTGQPLGKSPPRRTQARSDSQARTGARLALADSTEPPVDGAPPGVHGGKQRRPGSGGRPFNSHPTAAEGTDERASTTTGTGTVGTGESTQAETPSNNVGVVSEVVAEDQPESSQGGLS